MAARNMSWPIATPKLWPDSAKHSTETMLVLILSFPVAARKIDCSARKLWLYRYTESLIKNLRFQIARKNVCSLEQKQRCHCWDIMGRFSKSLVCSLQPSHLCCWRNLVFRYMWICHLFLCRLNIAIGRTNLKDLEWFFRQDPYVCIEYGSSRFQTRTCTGGPQLLPA